MPEEQPIPQWLNDQGCVAVDWPCVRCGSNLHSRHEADGCPTCGTPISSSGPHPPKGKLIDVDWSPPKARSFRIWVVALAVLVLAPVTIVIVAVGWALITVSGWLGWAAIAIVGAVGLLAWNRIARRRSIAAGVATQDALEGCDGDITRAIETALARYASLRSDDTLVDLAAYFVNTGHVGLAVRIGQQSLLRNIDPIAVPFEAVPFDEHDERFEALSTETVPGPTGLLARLLTRDDQPETWRTYCWWMHQGRHLAAAFIVLGVLIAARMLWDQSWSVLQVFWVVNAVLIAFAMLRDFTERRYRLFFVPGGVVSRTPRGPRGCDVEIYSRLTSTLVLLQTDRDTFFWTVAGLSGRWFGHYASAREAEMLLRVWLSPIQPPEMEHLADFQ